MHFHLNHCYLNRVKAKTNFYYISLKLKFIFFLPYLGVLTRLRPGLTRPPNPLIRSRLIIYRQHKKNTSPEVSNQLMDPLPLQRFCHLNFLLLFYTCVFLYCSHGFLRNCKFLMEIKFKQSMVKFTFFNFWINFFRSIYIALCIVC